MRASRREFVWTGMSWRLAASCAGAHRADLILYNGDIWTVNPRHPRAQAVAVSDGLFLAVGSNQDVLHLAGGRPKKLTSSKFVLPGFIEAHCHPVDACMQHLLAVNGDLRSIAEILAALHGRAAQTPRGAWVAGFKYDDTKTSEARPLTREDLDAGWLRPLPALKCATAPG